ncbi:LysR family transcriptional regulator [Caenimonas sedimenti]|uniref:LysR family transcriptional regulator n=1 Tax=Caenimonas sedimenti TaxID=2596921 RepID=A0A562ZXZ1_9BURK|nr:LysR substrate-binding domain-containing protein [Caenimonas sedimenti]TWO73343.1 LysR family transcriptional regulator [Caenimonas sedimenti]
MRRLQPPIHLLQAFVTTTRFGSISRAAEALHLTQSAVSKQVQELERHLGVALFERVRQRISLTPAGARYEASVRPLLSQLESATLEAMASHDGGGMLHLSALPTFSAKALIPRLPSFQKLHPQIALHFVPYTQGYDFSRKDLDCSILYGVGHWPGATATYLAGREVTLIAPPAPLLARKLRKPQDVASQVLLHHTTVPNAWDEWCGAHGVRGVNTFAGPQLDQYHGLIRAVAAGMGLALVPSCLVQDDVASGVIGAPMPDSYRSEFGYWVCHPEARASFDPLVKFKDWLIAQFNLVTP